MSTRARALELLAPAPAWPAATLAAAGLLALASRTLDATVVVAAVGIAGVLAPSGTRLENGTDARRWVAAVAMGAVAFALGRIAASSVVLPLDRGAILAATVAAVAEEAFFRRFLYGQLLRWGAPAAVAGSAIAFAVVHVPSYGVTALPLDLAAGLLFGWQRWFSGTWSAPAATHVAANLFAFV